MKTNAFLKGVTTLGVDFFTGVPDSLLKPLNDALYTKYGTNEGHMVAANEGGAVALAAGHYIATGKYSLVYLQNSGIGNAFNPIVSLLDRRVYGIPCVFVVGWRGEPGIPDEPQHAFQGQITKETLALLDLTTFELDADTGEAAFAAMLEQAKPLLAAGQSIVFLAHKGAFTHGPKTRFDRACHLTREEALRALLASSTDRDIFVCTTGKTSREVFELREELGQDHDHDFLTVGSMGHAGMIALGIAKAKPDHIVWCLDGDGAALMHLGSGVVEAYQHCANLIHVILNNGGHESVGGMPVANGKIWFAPIARAVWFEKCFTAESMREIDMHLPRIRKECRNGKLCFFEILLRQGSRNNLGRPTLTPRENLLGLMRKLGSAPKITEDVPENNAE